LDVKLFHTLSTAECDFWLFAALKKHLKGIHFTCDEAVPAATGKWFQELPEEFYSSRFKSLFSVAYMGKWNIETKYTFRAIFYVLFHLYIMTK
jgi:hypothetical protein